MGTRMFRDGSCEKRKVKGGMWNCEAAVADDATWSIDVCPRQSYGSERIKPAQEPVLGLGSEGGPRISSDEFVAAWWLPRTLTVLLLKDIFDYLLTTRQWNLIIPNPRVFSTGSRADLDHLIRRHLCLRRDGRSVPRLGIHIRHHSPIAPRLLPSSLRRESVPLSHRRGVLVPQLAFAVPPRFGSTIPTSLMAYTAIRTFSPELQ